MVDQLRPAPKDVTDTVVPGIRRIAAYRRTEARHGLVRRETLVPNGDNMKVASRSISGIIHIALEKPAPENFQQVQEYFDSMTPVPRDLPPIEVKFSAETAGSRADLRS